MIATCSCDKNAAQSDCSRDSSVGRASDRRSEGPRFDPGSRHILQEGEGRGEGRQLAIPWHLWLNCAAHGALPSKLQ